ncbi:DUF4856 domain-containing protein [Cytophagales bacterium WSM2-2]|nr:DUF4856 domain-containing protein [Cytophagales bacterium WSM2-2]
MKFNYLLLSLFILGVSVSVISCKKDDVIPAYEVPTTYSFTNVNYAEASKRLVMIAQIETLMNTDNKAGGGTYIDSVKLKNMFANSGNPFSADSLNKSGFQLKDKTALSAQSVIQNFLYNQSLASLSTSPASNGTAGVGTTQTNSYILLSAKGVNYRQVFTKTMMAAMLANEMINLVKSSPDNNTVIAGKGTAMENAWDLAFGYFNVPVNFPTSTTGVKYLGSYCNQVNAGIGSNAILMDAFLKGRAAISHKDIAVKNVQADIIAKELELVVAAGAIHEIAEAKAGLTDAVQTVSRFSECMGFIIGLRYFSNKTITDAQFNTLYQTYLHNGDLYAITTSDMNNIVSTLASIYGFSNPGTI